MRRAYYRCERCPQSFIPYDDAVGLRDSISPGFRPLVCLAGTLLPSADAAEDIVRRYTGVRAGASRAGEGEPGRDRHAGAGGIGLRHREKCDSKDSDLSAVLGLSVVNWVN